MKYFKIGVIGILVAILCCSCLSLNNIMSAGDRNRMIDSIAASNLYTKQELSRITELLNTPGVSIWYDDFDDKYSAAIFDDHGNILDSLKAKIIITFTPVGPVKSRAWFYIDYSGSSWMFLNNSILKINNKVYKLNSSSEGNRKVITAGIVNETSINLIDKDFIKFMKDNFSVDSDLKLRANGSNYYCDTIITSEDKLRFLEFIELYEILKKN